MPRTDDVSRLAALAARMSVMAEGPGASYVPAGDHVHDSKPPTTGTGEALLDELRRRAERVRGPRSMRELVEWGERELEARAHTPKKPARSPKQIVLEDFTGHDYEAVGLILGVHKTTVWRWRVAAGADGKSGREVPV